MLPRVKWRFVVVYFDVIVVYSKSVTKHLVHVPTVVALLQNTVVVLELPNFFLLDSTLSYQGHKIRLEKLAVDSKNCESTCRSLLPIDQSKLRFFLGVCNAYHCFVSSSRLAVAPLKL